MQPRSACMRELAHMPGCAKLASGVLSRSGPLLCTGHNPETPPPLFDIPYLLIQRCQPSNRHTQLNTSCHPSQDCPTLVDSDSCVRPCSPKTPLPSH